MVTGMTYTHNSPDGYQQLLAMLRDGVKAPIAELLGFEMVKVERGSVVFEGKPDKRVYNPKGGVHGGYVATLLDSACGLSTHSMLGPNRSHTTLDLKVSYHRGLTDQSGTVRAVGRVVTLGRRVAHAEATLHDGAGKLCATATSTLLVFDVEPQGRGAMPS